MCWTYWIHRSNIAEEDPPVVAEAGHTLRNPVAARMQVGPPGHPDNRIGLGLREDCVVVAVVAAAIVEVAAIVAVVAVAAVVHTRHRDIPAGERERERERERQAT